MKALTLAAAAAFAMAWPLATAHAAVLTGGWNMEEPSPSSVITDLVSNTASAAFTTGIQLDSTTTPAAPGSTQSLLFDGAATGVSTLVDATDLHIAGTGAKTLVAWIKTSSTAKQGILSYSPFGGGGAGANLRFAYDPSASGNGLRLELSQGAAASGNQVDLSDNHWHMVAAIIPDQAISSDISFYIDGTIYSDVLGGTQAVDTASSNPSAINPDVNFLQIGSMQLDNPRVFVGNIDDVGVYGEALSQNELDSLRTTGMVPEPASLALLSISGLMLLGRRRRA
jgi:hypothetical protein